MITKNNILTLCATFILLPISTEGQEIPLGSSAVGDTGGIDGWSSNMVIREEAIYINTTPDEITISGTTFEFGVGNARSRVTPFLVQLNDTNDNGDFTDDNDFQVLAVGTTREAGIDYATTGVFSLPFSESASAFTVAPGTAVGAAFMDSNPDGTGGEAGSVIPFDGGVPVGAMWYAGNSGTTHPNPIGIGVP
ncbi:hypothetical protein OAL23_01315, partial [bacterium]|nr:hypothetical protein [bacterium]